MSRTIHLTSDFLVDGIHAVHDGSGRIWYAVQSIDRDHSNAKYCQVYCEQTPGTLDPVLRIDTMIGAPHICIRPDGTAYVCGGGREKTIETGVSIPGFVPLMTTTTLATALAALKLAVEKT